MELIFKKMFCGKIPDTTEIHPCCFSLVLVCGGLTKGDPDARKIRKATFQVFLLSKYSNIKKKDHNFQSISKIFFFGPDGMCLAVIKSVLAVKHERQKTNLPKRNSIYPSRCSARVY